MSEIKTIGVFTSGGDSPGMNACLRAAVRTGIFHGKRMVGIRRGYAGMIEGDFFEMDSASVSNIVQRGGTILKSARSEAFRTEEGRQKAFGQLQKAGIDALVAIGGDGTYAGARVLHEEYGVHVIGCPGTIDNDLFGTDFTIGYDTALNTAVEAIDKIRDTAASHDRLFFIEVMGRDAGFIALNAGIAGGAEAVLVPETKTDIDQVIEKLETGWNRQKSSSIIVVAEGDDAGGAIEIARKVKEKFDEYDTRVTILGHIQRGGIPTCMDRVRASEFGTHAVKALLNGQFNQAVGKVNGEIVFTPFEEAIKHHHDIDPGLLELVEILSS